MLTIALLACTVPNSVRVADLGPGDAGEGLDTGAELDTGEALDTGDTGAARPCTFLDNWKGSIHLPPQQVYSYAVEGCGVIAFSGLACDDDAIATGTWDGFDLSAGPATLYVNAWAPGFTTCAAFVEDYAFPDVLTSYTVEITVQ